MKLAMIALALSSTLLTGCASMVGETEYPVAIASTPEGANFEVRNSSGSLVHSGITPNTVVLKSSEGYFKGAQYSVLVKKPGYLPQTTQVRSSISGWYWGNIGFGGLIGMLVVDPATGAMYKLPERTDISLSPDEKISQK